MCIRDRVSTQSTWGNIIHQHPIQQMRLLVVLVLVACAVAKWNHFDRCDPKWVFQVQRGNLYDCEDPKKENEVIEEASFITISSDVVSAWNVHIDGELANPDVLSRYFNTKEWANFAEFFQTLSVEFTRLFHPQIEDFTQIWAKGDAVIGIVSRDDDHQECVLLTGLASEGESILNAYNSRGQLFEVPFFDVHGKPYALHNLNAAQIFLA
eukprot:TRINITY_DN4649_c0_g1_i2.p1 TRINITY_DN4649_c0_g1~~TRINITY_DN4649_c0_g1_i2.p1  ORF type:complete len:230 (-),score=79.12 TRINITY_DN4649_c0_g1_i2:252-881(-)